MALFAKSKVNRFQEEPRGSGLGPGYYDPCVPQSSEYNAGSVSLGFTAPKDASRSPSRGRSSAAGRRKASASPPRGRRCNAQSRSMRRMTMGGPPAQTSAVSRLLHVEAEHQAKQLAWSEREREKLQAEANKLREREVKNISRGSPNVYLSSCIKGYDT